MHQEMYSITWHNYSDHLRSMMKELMTNEDFSDVTLVTEDKKHLKANANILSSCSPVFEDILKKDKNSSRIIFLRGVQHSEMESIIQYIYLGEAKFYMERIDEFFGVAKSLEIKELCNPNPKTELNDETECDPSPEDQDTAPELVEEQVFHEERKDDILAVTKSLEIKELCNPETELNDDTKHDPSQDDQDTSPELLEEQAVISGKKPAPKKIQECFDKVTGKYQKLDALIIIINNTLTS